MNKMFSISAAMARLGVGIEQSEGILAREAARQVAFALPLPPEALPDDLSPSVFYDNTHGAAVETVLGEVNESAACDFECALKAAKAYWMARYDALHNPASDFADHVCRSVDPVIVEIVSPIGEPIESLESLANSMDVKELRSAVRHFLKGTV